MPEVDASRPADRSAVRAVKAPAKQALVLICRRCERRVDRDGNAGRRLARRLRKLGRQHLGKGAIRTVFTGCMSLCPRDALAIAIVPGKDAPAQAPRMCIVDARRPKAAARGLLNLLTPNPGQA